MKPVKKPKIGNLYFTRSGLKMYNGKDRNKGHEFAPVNKGERRIYYTTEEIEAGSVFNPFDPETIVGSKWGALKFLGYDKSKAKYVFVDGSGNIKDCSIQDFIQDNITKSTASKPVKQLKEEKKKEDFGRKAPGARKDLFGVVNLKEINPALRNKLLFKKTIIPKPDVAEIYKRTNDKRLAYLFQAYYNALPSKPEYDAEYDIKKQELYMNYLKFMWQYALDNWKSYEEVHNHKDDFLKFLDAKNVLALKKTGWGVNTYVAVDYPYDYVKKLLDIYSYINSKYTIESKMRNSKFLMSTDEIKLDDYIIFSNPKIERDGFDRTFIKYRARKGIYHIVVDPEKIKPDLWYVAKYAGGLIWLAYDVATEKEAREIAIADYDKNHRKISTATGKKKEKLVWDLVDSTRVAGKLGARSKKNAEAKDFLKTFGLSGEFGNWLTDNDRTMNMNYAYDAFNDLALAMGIPTKSVSLGNELIIAFGSRGKGSAMAHYEADTNVINLTKLKGAGCVSHEWTHALDFNVGQRLGCGISLTSAFEHNPNSVPEPVRKVLTALKYNEDGSETKFYKDAKFIDEKYTARDNYGYWQSLVEMFARAGDSYTKDKLAELGVKDPYLCGKSQYVVDPQKHAINPQGKEAKRINKLFEEMMAYLNKEGLLG